MRLVIVGGGVTGVNVARFVAQRAPGTSIELYSDEQYLYYPRPKLPAFLAGELALEELIQYPKEWYAELGIRVHTGCKVARIIPGEHCIVTDSGEKTSYDRLLLATGGHSFVPPIAGASRPGVLTVWSVDDVLRVREYARATGSALVVGGGLLGLELARGLRVLGLDVTVIELFPRLLPRQLDAEGAEILTGLIEATGIRVIVGAATDEILGDGRVSEVRLKDGRKVPGGLVLICAGSRSNVSLAREAGLEIGRGVVVNEQMMASEPDVFAAGDVAEFNGRVGGIIPVALAQARVTAANIVESGLMAYEAVVPSNTLKVVGIDLTSIGVVNPEGDGYLELRSADPVDGSYKKLVLKDGVIVGAILLGNKRDVVAIGRAISEGVDASAYIDHLLDDGFDFGQLGGKDGA